MNIHDTVNNLQTAAACQIKKDKSNQLMKNVFDISFADEDIKSDEGKEKATSQKKKKSKIDKKLTEDVDSSE